MFGNFLLVNPIMLLKSLLPTVHMVLINISDPPGFVTFDLANQQYVYCQNSEFTLLQLSYNLQNCQIRNGNTTNPTTCLHTIVQGIARIFLFVVLALAYKYNTICSCTC
jgi:hypothetical protein